MYILLAVFITIFVSNLISHAVYLLDRDTDTVHFSVVIQLLISLIALIVLSLVFIVQRYQ